MSKLGKTTGPEDRPNAVTVIAKETFKAALDGVTVVLFKKGVLHPEAIDKKRIQAYLTDGRLVLATKEQLAKAKAEADKAVKDQAAADKNREDRYARLNELAKMDLPTLLQAAADAKVDTKGIMARETLQSQIVKTEDVSMEKAKPNQGGKPAPEAVAKAAKLSEEAEAAYAAAEEATKAAEAAATKATTKADKEKAVAAVVAAEKAEEVAGEKADKALEALEALQTAAAE